MVTKKKADDVCRKLTRIVAQLSVVANDIRQHDKKAAKSLSDASHDIASVAMGFDFPEPSQ